MEEKAAIYKASADNSGAWQAHNNLGAVQLEMGNLDEAATQLEIAANKMQQLLRFNLIWLLFRLCKWITKKAYATLGSIGGGSNDVQARVRAMKGYEVRMAEYDKAKASFASAEESDAASIDNGLAFLLAGDHTQSSTSFGKVGKDSEMYGTAKYLQAVAAARRSDSVALRQHLKDAVTADPSLKDAALNDLEFANYADDVNEAVK